MNTLLYIFLYDILFDIAVFGPYAMTGSKLNDQKLNIIVLNLNIIGEKYN
jgi:hypothetical protein